MFGRRERRALQLSEPEPGADKRRHARLPFTDTGRYMLSDGQEFGCRTVDVSLDGVSLTGPLAGRVGERVVAYFDRLGRVEGVLRRVTPSMFALEFSANEVRRQKFRLRLLEIFQDESLLFTDEPAADSGQRARRFVIVRAPYGDISGEMVALSTKGAEVVMEAAPPVGTAVRVTGRLGVVVSRTAESATIEFDKPRPSEAG